jgi:2-phospho-L-lactate guanylyltransferase (CobY/MobA/RfbA family)
VLNLPGIAVDVDDPPDLQRLLSLPGETRAQRLGREWNLANASLAAKSDAL